jgi:predicted RNA-binding protein with RPS1 domain
MSADPNSTDDKNQSEANSQLDTGQQTESGAKPVVEAESPETTAPEPPVAEETMTVAEASAAPIEQETPTPAADAGATPGESSELKPKISIGSQRDTANRAYKNQPKAVQAAKANPIQLTAEPEPAETGPEVEIHSTAGLGEDLDAEIEAALGDFSMDDVVSQTETAETELEANSRVKGVVTKIHNDNVFLKLNGQYEGVAALHHFKEAPEEGDLVEVIVRGVNKEDGLYELAVPGAAVGVADWEDIAEGAIVEARVSGSNTGGLEVMVNSIRGFIPASQIDRFRVEDFSQYVNQKFPCVVMEVNPNKRKLVLSRRAILDRENEEKRKQLLAELEAGQLREGVVTKLMDFGAFVDLGGVEGLIHISKLSWSRVKHPSEVVNVGDKVSVKVEKIDEAANRISLSLRDTMEHPWEKVPEQFSVDDMVKGTVTRIADFGAFVKIAPGVEGLVHISELAYHRVAKVSTVVKEGQEIDVKILSMDLDSQKISLSHKSCLAPPAPKQSGEKTEEAEEPARELAVPGRNEPLKGGTDRKSGGEDIGLNW